MLLLLKLQKKLKNNKKIVKLHKYSKMIKIIKFQRKHQIIINIKKVTSENKSCRDIFINRLLGIEEKSVTCVTKFLRKIKYLKKRLKNPKISTPKNSQKY